MIDDIHCLMNKIDLKKALFINYNTINFGTSSVWDQAYGDECHLTPVIHVLQHPGCIPKPIPSFACSGKCTSYVQVS